ESLKQIDRVLRERTGRFAAHDQRTDDIVAPKQWNHKQCPIPSAGDDVLGRCLGDGRKVLNLCCVATTYSAFEDWLAEPDMLIPQRRDQLLAHAVSRAQLQFFLLLIELVDRASFRAGEQDCSRHDGGQHGCEVERRVDRLAYVAESAQLFNGTGEI